MGKDAIDRIEETLKQHSDYLVELDSAIGDADHGTNMCRGFAKAKEKIDKTDYSDLSSLFKELAMAMMSGVGGSAGPLYGTFFMKAGQEMGKENRVSLETLAGGLKAGLAGVQALGKAQEGDKTMVDTLAPAIKAFNDALPDEKGALEAMASAAEAGMMSTVDMLAKKGRASYLGERSVGHQDPGATSAYLILNCLKASVLEGEGNA